MNDFEKQSEKNNDNYNSLSEMPSFEQWRAEQTKEQTEKEGEINPKKLELFNQFVDFFQKNSNIKRTLTELAPNEQDFYNESGTIEYADKFYKATKDVVNDIQSIMDNFYTSETIKNRLKQIEIDVTHAGANPDKLTSVYQKDFASMSEDFSRNIHEKIVGYNDFSNPHQFDTKANSINEILHLIHSSIINNENILQSLPILKNDGEFTLYGTANSENPVAKEIYHKIKDSDESSTDIVSLPDRTLMMVRDRGHALTIDIEKDAEDGKFYINYFVPKICNVDKVNQLPGVRKVAKKEGKSQVREFTTGVFNVENEADVANAVINFINIVPTDYDIQRP